MGRFHDLSGQQFGKLTVIERKGKNKHKQTLWLCVCKCGNQVVTTSGSLVTGTAQSCGCSRGESNTKHGMAHTRLYHIWANIIQRCENPNNSSYKNYGGRGITVCDDWKNDFQTFYDWSMANGYLEDLTIDRIDVNGNYEPSNCRWTTIKEQGFNRRNNHFITFNGKTQTMREWSEELNIDYDVIAKRLNVLHWDVEKTLTTK
jgi:hypothetical protein